jgi:non-specific serine/threonine protein kinase
METADPDRLPPLANLRDLESTRLFVERAAAVRAEFVLTDQNAGAVVSVCRRLDGMPLAIELAAARMKAMAAEQIAQGLDDCFHLLKSGSRTASPRQQTLEATIDWSYNLLTLTERTLFRRLAVFVGGWTLEAAEAVCSDDDLAKDDILDLLSELVDKSLIKAEERAGAMRYSSLETIRQYGNEKLVESGEGQRVRRRHLEYFLGFAEEGARELRGPKSLEWARRIELEYSNIRAALEHAFWADGQDDTGPKLTIAMAGGPGHGYWHRRSQFNEAHFWLEKALDRGSAQVGTATRAALLFHYAVFMNNRPDWPEVRPLLEESLTTFRSLGESYRTHRAYVLVWLGFKLCCHEEFRMGTRYLEEALAIFERSGDKWGQGHALNFLCGTRFDMEMDADAWPLAQQGLAVARECGEPFLLAIFLNDIGWFLVGQGQNDVGKAYLEEALAIYQDFESKGFALQVLRLLGDVARRMNECGQAETYYRDSQRMAQDIGWLTYGADLSMLLGLIRLNEGKLADATTCFVEALNVCRQCGYQQGLVACLDCLAAARTVQTRFSEAARLFGAFDAQIESWLAKGFTKRRLFDGIDLMEHDRYLSFCRDQLDEVTFKACFAEGRAMTLEEALAHGLAEAEMVVTLPSAP